MQYLDIVNQQDEVIGRASYDEVYKRHLAHRLVHVLVFNQKGEMALQLRSQHKKFCPHYWGSAAAGHVWAGESYQQAALRELSQGPGVTQEITFLYKDFYSDSTHQIGLKKFIATFKAIHNGPFRLDEQKVDQIEFFSMKEIQHMIHNGEKFHPELLFLLAKHYGINL